LGDLFEYMMMHGLANPKFMIFVLGKEMAQRKVNFFSNSFNSRYTTLTEESAAQLKNIEIIRLELTITTRTPYRSRMLKTDSAS